VYTVVVSLPAASRTVFDVRVRQSGSSPAGSGRGLASPLCSAAGLGRSEAAAAADRAGAGIPAAKPTTRQAAATCATGRRRLRPAPANHAERRRTTDRVAVTAPPDSATTRGLAC
jgi:hypothetical protein